MYQYFCAVIIGIVEGMTEYLPVSSTGHMIIVSSMLNFTGDLAKFFEVFIQLGAILSVLVVYKEKFIFMLDTHHWFRKKRTVMFQYNHFDDTGMCYGTFISRNDKKISFRT